MDDIDAYAELRTLMRDLEARGVPVPDIIDAAMRLSIGAASRLYGPAAAAESLIEMAETVDDGLMMPPPGCWLH